MLALLLIAYSKGFRPQSFSLTLWRAALINDWMIRRLLMRLMAQSAWKMLIGHHCVNV
jgi:hypothetical protein